MTPAEKLAIVSGLTQAVTDLALAGIRLRYRRRLLANNLCGWPFRPWVGTSHARRSLTRRSSERVAAPIDPIAVAVQIADAFTSLGVQHTIGGSIASSIAGEPRSTLDIDVVAALEERHVARLAEMLRRDF